MLGLHTLGAEPSVAAADAEIVPPGLGRRGF